MTLNKALKNCEGKTWDPETCAILGCFAHATYKAFLNIEKTRKLTNEEMEDKTAIETHFPWVKNHS